MNAIRFIVTLLVVLPIFVSANRFLPSTTPDPQYLEPTKPENIQITDFSSYTPAFAYEECTLSLTVTGMGTDYIYTEVYLYEGNHSQEDECIAIFPIDSSGKDTDTFMFNGTLPLPAGEYNVYFKDEDDKLISGNFELTIYKRSGEFVKVYDIQLDKKFISDKVGASFRLTATVRPDNATIKDISWASINPEIVSVDQKGFVRLLSPGRTSVTATAKDGSRVTGICTIEVLPAESGVGSIAEDDEVDVFTMSGSLLIKCRKKDLRNTNLPSGVYILSSHERAIKISIP